MNLLLAKYLPDFGVVERERIVQWNESEKAIGPAEVIRLYSYSLENESVVRE